MKILKWFQIETPEEAFGVALFFGIILIASGIGFFVTAHAIRVLVETYILAAA